MLAGTLDRWQQQCQLISTACKLRGGAGVIGVQRAQTSAANCWLLREQGKAKGAWEGGWTRTSWSGCLFLIQAIVQTQAARGLRHQHRSRWHDATRGRGGWEGSRLACLTCCLLGAMVTVVRVAAGSDNGSGRGRARRIGALRGAERGIPRGEKDKVKPCEQ